METSIFLAKLMGPLFVAMGLAVLLHPQRIRQMGQEFIESEALIYLSGVLTLPAGLAIVNTHNIWIFGWPVIITVFGWLMILAGLSRILLSGPIKAIGSKMIEQVGLFTIPGVLMALLGGFLSYQGYLA